MKVQYSRPYAKRSYRVEKNEKQKRGKSAHFYWRSMICGLIFVLGIALKLLLPNHLERTRETMERYMVREADFVSAFSAIGHAVRGEEPVSQSVREACVAVFGGNQDATEAFAPQEETARELRAFPQYASQQERVLNFDYQSPLHFDAITSEFAWREDTNGGEDTFHYGIDLAAKAGSEITSFADGTVGIVGESAELGHYLTIQHPNGITTLYGHCSSIDVHSGDNVKIGQRVAAVGESGNATGAHLHFALQDGEVYLNPQYYLPSQPY